MGSYSSDKKNARFYGLKFSRTTDREIIERLDKQENIQQYIKNLIKNDMKEDKTMKKYTIKPEYWHLWGAHVDEKTIVTQDDVERFASDWEEPVEELLEQLDPLDDDNRLWYAVQRDQNDDWGNGSYDLEEAKRMAAVQMADYPETLIAVIDNRSTNPVCIEEITDF